MALKQTRLAAFPMDLREKLFFLSKSEANRFAAVKALLESLTEDQRREAVKYKDEVSASCDQLIK